tara:strand:+ start:407 stop:565 length:159 start_codon:yes stop_codon:yes gene_type:complete
MQEVEVQAYIRAIMGQRNAALNTLAEVEAKNFMLQAELQKLKEAKEAKDDSE